MKFAPSSATKLNSAALLYHRNSGTYQARRIEHISTSFTYITFAEENGFRSTCHTYRHELHTYPTKYRKGAFFEMSTEIASVLIIGNLSELEPLSNALNNVVALAKQVSTNASQAPSTPALLHIAQVSPHVMGELQLRTLAEELRGWGAESHTLAGALDALAKHNIQGSPAPNEGVTCRDYAYHAASVVGTHLHYGECLKVTLVGRPDEPRFFWVNHNDHNFFSVTPVQGISGVRSVSMCIQENASGGLAFSVLNTSGKVTEVIGEIESLEIMPTVCAEPPSEPRINVAITDDCDTDRYPNVRSISTPDEFGTVVIVTRNMQCIATHVSKVQVDYN